MAKMEFSGVQEMMDALFAETERLERKATEMLGEAGKCGVDAWQRAIEKANHAKPGKSGRATNDMLNSVRATVPRKGKDGWETRIYPQGRDRKRQKTAEIAFVLHYGTSKIKGDQFVDNAEEDIRNLAYPIMEEVWNRD